MGNYTNYRNRYPNQGKPEQPANPVPANETPAEPVETPDNTAPVNETPVETVETTVNPAPPVEAPAEKPGRVVNCEKLNVRKSADKDSEILCTIDSKTNFTVNESESTAGFYKVTLSSGIEGFCMRKYVVI